MAKYNPQQLQQKFERWHQLYQQQLTAQQQWLEAQALYTELKQYYQSPQWMADHDKDLELEYSGEAHSILSEDGLWNMLIDHDEMAKRWIRLGLDAIDDNKS